MQQVASRQKHVDHFVTSISDLIRLELLPETMPGQPSKNAEVHLMLKPLSTLPRKRVGTRR